MTLISWRVVTTFIVCCCVTNFGHNWPFMTFDQRVLVTILVFSQLVSTLNLDKFVSTFDLG